MSKLKEDHYMLKGDGDVKTKKKIVFFFLMIRTIFGYYCIHCKCIDMIQIEYNWSWQREWNFIQQEFPRRSNSLHREKQNS
ncbi:hypothetical protein MA16_Dca014146 [Dendrobium catenatum]|uniref:Uncharacterized protein n=1 Tax=Dendrobium catenatum TaxID=906689 RepID=A0A2I0VTH9_9ASPA|nr:hypothetical protein MA16_Dca014146 [Dendrobium catenatum]